LQTATWLPYISTSYRPIRLQQIFCNRTRSHTFWFSTTRVAVVSADTPRMQDAWATCVPLNSPLAARRKDGIADRRRNKNRTRLRHALPIFRPRAVREERQFLAFPRSTPSNNRESYFARRSIRNADLSIMRCSQPEYDRGTAAFSASPSACRASRPGCAGQVYSMAPSFVYSRVATIAA
jgi:hypothetical protein